MVALASALLGAGCYHATIVTGRAQSGTMIERKWAHSFLYGLVPPNTVETAAQCANGVARVETQLSFLNQVANAITLGIYSPMTIQVWCASPGEEEDALVLDAPAGAAGRDATFAEAATRSLREDAPVYVRFAAPLH
jgi:hypothetical protein